MGRSFPIIVSLLFLAAGFPVYGHDHFVIEIDLEVAGSHEEDQKLLPSSLSLLNPAEFTAQPAHTDRRTTLITRKLETIHSLNLYPNFKGMDQKRRIQVPQPKNGIYLQLHGHWYFYNSHNTYLLNLVRRASRPRPQFLEIVLPSVQIDAPRNPEEIDMVEYEFFRRGYIPESSADIDSLPGPLRDNEGREEYLDLHILEREETPSGRIEGYVRYTNFLFNRNRAADDTATYRDEEDAWVYSFDFLEARFPLIPGEYQVRRTLFSEGKVMSEDKLSFSIGIKLIQHFSEEKTESRQLLRKYDNEPLFQRLSF